MHEPLELGFTGTRKGMTDEQREAVRVILSEHYSLARVFKAIAFFHHGDCVGADYEAASLAEDLGFVVVGHPPSNKVARVYYPSRAEHEAKGYLQRNADIVNCCELLIATPESHIEALKGSGTWWTVRYARGKKPIKLVLPTGKVVDQ